MDELDAGLRISLGGPEARAALDRLQRQLDAWGLAMPPAPFLVLDFGLRDFDHIGLIEYWIANETDAGYCGKLLYVHGGQTCPLHSHREKMETFFVVKGRVRMQLDGSDREMVPGDVLPVPQGKAHTFTGVGPALLLEVSTPCRVDDNYFADARVPIGGNYQQGGT